jgi:hypothetical protein
VIGGFESQSERRLDRFAKSTEVVEHSHALLDAPDMQKGVKLSGLVE